MCSCFADARGFHDLFFLQNLARARGSVLGSPILTSHPSNLPPTMAAPRISLSLGASTVDRPLQQSLRRCQPFVRTSLPLSRLSSRPSKRDKLLLRASTEEPEPEQAATTATEDASPDVSTPEAGEEDGGSFAGKFFGTYLQLTVWVVVLSLAAYKGFSNIQADPDSVGLLIAPPSAALFLIGSFLYWRFVANKEKFD